MTSLRNHSSQLQKKIEESPNKHGLLEESKQLEITTLASAALSLSSELSSGAPKAQEMQAALGLLESIDVPGCRLILSERVWLKLLEVKCAEFMLFRNIKAYRSLFADDAPEAGC